MRISDWSSDVCSSDLELDVILIALERDLWVLMAELATDAANREKLIPGGSLVTLEMITKLEELIDDLSARSELPRAFVVPGQDRCSALLDLARQEIGRASCRERVCQYV